MTLRMSLKAPATAAPRPHTHPIRFVLMEENLLFLEAWQAVDHTTTKIPSVTSW